jgi:hypothetical protein
MAAPFHILEGNLPIELTIPPSEKVKPEFVILKNGVEGFAERIEVYKNHGYTILKIIGDEKQRVFASSIAMFLIKTYPAVYGYINTPNMINEFQKYILETYKDRYTLFGLTGKAVKAMNAAIKAKNAAAEAAYSGSVGFAPNNYAKKLSIVTKELEQAEKMAYEIQNEVKGLSTESNTSNIKATITKCENVIGICRRILEEIAGQNAFSEHSSKANKIGSFALQVGQHLSNILANIKKENNARNINLTGLMAKTLNFSKMNGEPQKSYAAHLLGKKPLINNTNDEKMGGGKRRTNKRKTRKHSKKSRSHRKSSKKTMHKRSTRRRN